MEKRSFWDSISIFETGLSAAEWAWRIITLIFIGGSGTVTAFMAKADPLLSQLGSVYWVAVGIITALVVALIFYFIKSANLRQAEADFNRAMAVPRHSINPLSESFKDLIIAVEDMRLPTLQLHENKQFKHCQFIGPAAIAILGGTYVNSSFKDCGDIVALPKDVWLTGIIVLKNCTVENCEFIRTTIFTDQNTAKGIAENLGMDKVKGIIT